MQSTTASLLVILTLLLAGCVAIAPQPQVSPVATAATAPTIPAIPTAESNSVAPTAQAQVVPDPAKATVLGQIFLEGQENVHPPSGTVMWLAEVHWNADKTDGAFVLNGAASPSATTKDDGSFVFADVPLGDYAIIVGDPMGVNAIVLEPEGKAKVVTLEAGETVDVGILKITMAPSGGS